MSSGAALAFSDVVINIIAPFISTALNYKPGTGPVPQAVAYAAAFSPNPDNPPLFVDYPLEEVSGELKMVESVWEKWLAHDPVELIDDYKSKSQQLHAIRFDCGTSDGLVENNRVFSQALTDAGIPHIFEEYPGDHCSGVRQQMETKVLPFFSDVLTFEMLLETNVQPRGKLATTWGEMKHGR